MTSYGGAEMLGVCINYFHENYGGMLQAYATVNLIEKTGVDYELIRYEKNLSLSQKIRFVLQLLNRYLLKDRTGEEIVDADIERQLQGK